MALIANYRGIKHGDAAALLLAQRWSKYMAVTFAVGAVTGTVLSFEFGLLWPRFMGQWGAAFGVPFAFEGIFFFTEAIFISIYIFGWRRLKPWTHFWTGVPVVLTGILGSISVVAANAWMNAPEGFTLNRQGEVVDVDPWKVIFNDAMPLMAAHMVVAAYVVGGFLVASVYAVGMFRAAGPLPPSRVPDPVLRRHDRKETSNERPAPREVLRRRVMAVHAQLAVDPLLEDGGGHVIQFSCRGELPTRPRSRRQPRPCRDRSLRPQPSACPPSCCSSVGVGEASIDPDQWRGTRMP